jgi:hypothetical protein
MKSARINVMVSVDEWQVLVDYQQTHKIKTRDEAMGRLLKHYESLAMR